MFIFPIFKKIRFRKVKKNNINFPSQRKYIPTSLKSKTWLTSKTIGKTTREQTKKKLNQTINSILNKRNLLSSYKFSWRNYNLNAVTKNAVKNLFNEISKHTKIATKKNYDSYIKFQKLNEFGLPADRKKKYIIKFHWGMALGNEVILLIECN